VFRADVGFTVWKDKESVTVVVDFSRTTPTGRS
jgi:hypothetical protein